ncbi:MAG: imidazole glycerol phosphate synthase subunit HisH [Actinomycetes bacterium]
MTAPRVAVLDYRAGNVRSAQRGLVAAGAEAFITGDADVAGRADALLVPGVGAFGSCLTNLRAAGLVDLLADWIDRERPVFGICIGMQLLYTSSEEQPEVPGLGLLPGGVVRFPAGATVPHMGWDVVSAAPGHEDDPLLEGVSGERCYFVHGYYAVPEHRTHVVAVCDYAGASFPCVVREGSVVGTQFHPEKSGPVGTRLLRNWVTSL